MYHTQQGSQQPWHILSPFIIAAAGALWGMIGLFSKFLSKAGLNALQITEVRCLVSAAILGLFLLFTKREYLKINLQDLWLFIGTGVFSIAFFNVCYFLTISESSLSIACILLYTAPCFVMLLSCLLFREQFTLRKGIAVLLALVGCMYTTGIINGSSGTHVTGVALITGLGSGIGYALYSIIGRVALRKYNWLTLITYTFLFASIALLPFCKPVEIFRIAVSNDYVILNAVLLGVLSTLMPFLLYTKGLEHMDTGKAALLTFVEPAVATIISVTVFHEVFTRYIGIGIVLVILSIVVVNYQKDLLKFSRYSAGN